MINLPPCPDCHQPVDDIRQRDELRMKLDTARTLRAVDPRRDITLVPCGCKAADFTLVTEGEHTYLSDLHMISGRGWRYFIEVGEVEAISWTVYNPSIARLDTGARNVLESGHDKQDE